MGADYCIMLEFTLHKNWWNCIESRTARMYFCSTKNQWIGLRN